MEKSLFEQNGGTYRQVGDYLLPNITLPEEETYWYMGTTTQTILEAKP